LEGLDQQPRRQNKTNRGRKEKYMGFSRPHQKNQIHQKKGWNREKHNSISWRKRSGAKFFHKGSGSPDKTLGQRGCRGGKTKGFKRRGAEANRGSLVVTEPETQHESLPGPTELGRRVRGGSFANKPTVEKGRGGGQGSQVCPPSGGG